MHKGGGFINILENRFRVNRNGELVIPKDVLEAMGLFRDDEVFAACIVDEAGIDRYHEFLLSSAPLDTPAHEEQLVVPDALLQAANIPVYADIQIVCLDGAIVLSGENTLSANELQKIQDELASAVTIAEQLAGDPFAPEVLQSWVEDMENRATEEDHHGA